MLDNDPARGQTTGRPLPPRPRRRVEAGVLRVMAGAWRRLRSMSTSCPIRSLRAPTGEGAAIETSRQFYGDASSVGETRTFVRDVLAETDAPLDVIDSAVLLVSELATNVALHARTDLQVTIRFEKRQLWAEVKDWNSRMPQTCSVPVDATSGRGLALVEALATRWGAERDDNGKRVWFLLEVGPASGSDNSS